MGKTKLLLDVDTGVDDAQGIMLALAAPDVQVLGITCTHGNTALENSCRNTLRVLKECQRGDIPVYRGSAEPLLGRMIDASDFHGKDGLGDSPDPQAPGLDQLQAEGAVEALIRLVRENPGEVNLVATGPLTNLALAVKLDPSLPEKLKGLYIMGGNIESRGNTTVCGEFNFVADPESAFIVLTQYRCPTFIASWEFSCRKARFMGRIYNHTMEVRITHTHTRHTVNAGLSDLSFGGGSKPVARIFGSQPFVVMGSIPSLKASMSETP
uniref:Inosine/uridine-preferring nucleoside hydrolase domain-containing protein n=1 Tax=Gadus morhua TaxID=8049 RepID=A0A8C4Z005_GADMO